MTDTTCDQCGAPLVAYKTKHWSTGMMERSRKCCCCGYRDVVLVRPSVVVKKLRVISEGIEQPVASPQPKKHR